MSDDFAHLLWPLDRLGEALGELIARAKLGDGQLGANFAPPATLDYDLDEWIERASAALRCEAEAVSSSYDAINTLVSRAGPAIIEMASDKLLLVLDSSKANLQVLGPDLSVQRVSSARLSLGLREKARRPIQEEIDAEMAALELSGRRRARIEEALASNRLGRRAVVRGWVISSEPSEPLLQQLVREGVHSRLIWAVLCHLLYTAVWLGSWYILGRGVFTGGISPGWFGGWLLCLLSMAFLRGIISYNQSEAGIRFVSTLKRVLLVGAVHREQDETAGEGLGKNLSYVFEATALENNGMRALSSAVLTVLELVYAPLLLAAGAGGLSHVVAFFGWLVFSTWLCRNLWVRRLKWTETRQRCAAAGLQALLGQRTQRVQGLAKQIHREEDVLLSEYAAATLELDRSRLWITTLLSRGWLVVGLLTLTPAVASGTWSTASIAVAVGGILFAYQALQKLAWGTELLVSSLVAWRTIEPIVRAATRQSPTGIPESMDLKLPEKGVLLEGDQLRYCYPSRTKAALEDVSVRVQRGEHLLLVGASGAGKSTLAQVLAGHRIPESGGLSLGGMDFASVGASSWRRRVALVPQFHNNHILMGPLALNLLMGRRWPPRLEDLQEAEAVCQELGLGDLIEEMPGGLWQMVGQTGWQLSHGERSRVFLARALLQEADLLIIDESLSSLDPEHIAMAAECVRRRAESLILIAHP